MGCASGRRTGVGAQAPGGLTRRARRALPVEPARRPRWSRADRTCSVGPAPVAVGAEAPERVRRGGSRGLSGRRAGSGDYARSPSRAATAQPARRSGLRRGDCTCSTWGVRRHRPARARRAGPRIGLSPSILPWPRASWTASADRGSCARIGVILRRLHLVRVSAPVKGVRRRWGECGGLVDGPWAHVVGAPRRFRELCGSFSASVDRERCAPIGVMVRRAGPRARSHGLPEHRAGSGALRTPGRADAARRSSKCGAGARVHRPAPRVSGGGCPGGRGCGGRGSSSRGGRRASSVRPSAPGCGCC